LPRSDRDSEELLEVMTAHQLGVEDEAPEQQILGTPWPTA